MHSICAGLQNIGHLLHTSRCCLWNWHTSKISRVLWHRGQSSATSKTPEESNCLIERRHCTIRSVFLKLEKAEPPITDTPYGVRAVRTSNDLYGSDTMSALELAKSYSKPLSANQKPISVDEALWQPHDKPIAKQKLTLIIRSKVYSPQLIEPSKVVLVFIKHDTEKCSKWEFTLTSSVDQPWSWINYLLATTL